VAETSGAASLERCLVVVVDGSIDKEPSNEVPASEVERRDRCSLARISSYFLEPRLKKNIL